MLTHCFSVYDSKADAHMHPFFMATVGMGLRAFADAVADPATSVSRHPADYTLFHLGTFDDATGQFQLFAAPKALGNGVEYKVESVPVSVDLHPNMSQAGNGLGV